MITKLFQRKPKCPYCQKTLDVEPRRKSKCPHCTHIILVRHGQLVTEDEAGTQDALARLQSLGVTRRDFDETRKKLSKEFGSEASVNDTVWRILNKTVAGTRELSARRWAYLEMAHVVSTKGRDPKPYLREAHKVNLDELRRAGQSAVEVIGPNDRDVCEECQAIQGRRYKLDEVPELPYDRCTNETGCRCWVVPVSSYTK